MTKKQLVLRTNIRPHGLTTEHERTLCHLLGCPEDWSPMAVEAWEVIAEAQRRDGYRENVCYFGYLLPYMAECVRIGIERGRRLERNCVLDALFRPVEW